MNTVEKAKKISLICSKRRQDRYLGKKKKGKKKNNN